MKRAIHILWVLTAFSLAAVPALAVGEDPLDVYEDGYEAGDYGRIRYQENEVTIIRSETPQYPRGEEPATTNSPIYPGDAIVTYYDQRAEVQLASGTLIRIDADSEVIFQALPDPYAEHPDNAIVQLAFGTIQLSARVGQNEEFRVDTPGASVYLLGDGDFRIEVDEDGRTRVLSRRGVAEVVSEGGSVLVRGGMRTTVYAGLVPDDPHSFNTLVMDQFDSWVRDRETPVSTTNRYAETQQVDPYDELPSEVRPYYSELTDHGRWVWVADYGYAWYPNGMPTNWRPYSRGYWSYGPGGYFWVSHEPWGWAPYHYGRWSFVGGYGWIWVPGRIFGGAWVSWSFGPRYVGWCPLGYYNTPVIAGGVRFGSYGRSSWSFVAYANLGHRDVHRYNVSVDHIGDDVHRHAVVTRPPRVSPRRFAEDPDARTRQVKVARDYSQNPRSGLSRRNPTDPFTDAETAIVDRRASNARPTTSSGGRKPSGLERPSDGRRSFTSTRPVTRGNGNGQPTRSLARRPSSKSAEGRVTTVRPTATDSSRPAARRPTRNLRTPDAPTAVGPGNSTRAPSTSPGRRAGTPRGRTPSTTTGENGRSERSSSMGAGSKNTKGTDTRVRPRANGSRDTGSNVKSMYERMAKPRTTERKKTPSASSSSPSRTKSPSRSSAGRSTPSSKSKAETQRKRSNDSSQKAKTPSKSSKKESNSPSTRSSTRFNSSTSRVSTPSARSSNRSSSSKSRASTPSARSSNRSSSSKSRASTPSARSSKNSGANSSRSSGSKKSSGGSSSSKSSGRKGGNGRRR